MTADPAPDDWAFGDGGFAKLYGDRLAQSSLLDTAVATRWLFFFMLSQADAEGRYRCATVAALARAGNVSREDAETAVRELEAPDPDSTTKDHEGRRILRIPGGWQVLNYTRYRAYQTKRQREEAEKKRRQRELAAEKRQDREAELARREDALRRREQAAGDMSRDIPGTSAPNIKRQTPDETDNGVVAPAAPPRLVRSPKRATDGNGNGAGTKRPSGLWPRKLAGLWGEILGGVVAPGRVGKALA